MATSWTTLTGAKTVEGSLKHEANNNRLPSSSLVSRAENWLEQKLRAMAMQERTVLTLLEGESEIDLAADIPTFLDPYSLWLNGHGEVTYVEQGSEFERLRAVNSDSELSTGMPGAYTIIGRSKILFDVEADDDYTMPFVYYGRPAALSSGNPTNVYTDSFETLLFWTCMGFAYLFMKDEARAKDYFGAASSHIADVNDTDDLIRRGQRFRTRTQTYG